MNIHLVNVLKQLCDTIGVDYEEIDFKELDWNKQHCWNYTQSVEFEDWMFHYIFDNDKVRRQLTCCKRDELECRQAVNIFIAMYGWRLSDG